MRRGERPAFRPCARGALVFAALLFAALPGCEDAAWLQYRDDPYLANIAGKGGSEVLRNINSTSPEQRIMALRVAAGRAGELREQGSVERARDLEEIVIRRYFVEKEDRVRACIVEICAPAMGRSPAMVRFLRDRIAAGEFPGYAALSLAAMAPRSAYADIDPLTRHPDPGVRYQAATALTVLGDPRGREGVRRVLRGMEPGLWPEDIGGVSRSAGRTGLEERARRAFGSL